MTKKEGEKAKVLVDVEEDKQFILADGTKISHYADLADILEHLHQDIVHHHISDLRNDFAVWIRDIFDEDELAHQLSKETDPQKIRLLIYKHLVKKYLTK